MQATIKFKCGHFKIPIHYNHIIQGFIYKNISDPNFREFLHEEGFKNGKRRFKLFSFSRLNGKCVFDNKEKMLIFPDGFSITVTSLVDDFINDLLQTFLFSKKLEINNQPIKVVELQIEENKRLSNKILVKALSPIVVYSTVSIDRRKKTIYHSPYDNIFVKQIKENLLRKAKVIGENIEDRNLIIQVAANKKAKEHVLFYKDIVIKGWSGIFQIEGDPKLLNIALNCGIGAKNSQGFGCIKMLKTL